MRLIYSLISICLLAFFSACEHKKASPLPKEKKLSCHLQLSSEELNEDFTLFTSTLQEYHPNLYRVCSKEMFDTKISSIKNELSDSLSYLEFLKLIAPLLTDIGCINTQWGHSTEYIKYRNANTPVFPIDFKIIEKRFIIDKNKSSNSAIKAGDEIIEINGVTVSEYLEKNYALLPIDGKIRTLQHKWLASFFPNHHSNFWEQPDTFNLKIIDDKKEIKTIKVEALLKEHIKQEASNDNPFRFEIVNDSIAMLKMGSFNNSVIDRHKLDFVGFINSSFQQIKDNRIKNLILDLSGNSWGDMLNAAFFYSYFTPNKFQYVKTINSNVSKKTPPTYLLSDLEALDSSSARILTSPRIPNELNYDGKLYVITDGWNINSGGFFCSKIRSRPQTVFVGETAGGSPFGMNGIQKMLTLPNSRISLFIPTVQFIANEDELENLSGNEVDQIINPPYVQNTIQFIQQK